MHPYNYALNNPILMIDPDGMSADSTKKANIPVVLPGIPLNEVFIQGVRSLGNSALNGLLNLGSKLSNGSVVGGFGSFFALMLMPSNSHQQWQVRDYGLPETFVYTKKLSQRKKSRLVQGHKEKNLPLNYERNGNKEKGKHGQKSLTIRQGIRRHTIKCH